MNGKNVGRSGWFKYLGSPQTKDGTSIQEVKIRLAQAHSAITRLAILWKNKAMSFSKNAILYKSLVLPPSILWMTDLDVDGGSGEAKPGL